MSICFGKSRVPHYQCASFKRRSSTLSPLKIGFCAFLLWCLAPPAFLIGQSLATTSEVSPPTAIGKVGVSVPIILSELPARFGPTAPNDSVATATVDITAGSTHSSGTLRVMTRGNSESAEEWTLADGFRRNTFSENFVALKGSDKTHEHSFELSLTAQSALFPLPWFMAKISPSDLQITDLGTEKINGTNCQHLRLSRAWQSNKYLVPYAKLTESDVWIDPVTGLPAKVSFERRKGLGAVPAIPISVEYTEYKPVSGTLYPFHIKQYVNGTLWADIQIQSVQFNAGLTASAFTNQ